MFLILHSTKYDYLGHVVKEGLEKILPDWKLAKNNGSNVPPDDYRVVVLTSLHPSLYAWYKTLSFPDRIKRIAIDTFDIYRDRPNYSEFDLVFLREYGEEHRDTKKVIPLSMGLTEDRIADIEEHSKPWKEREIDIFYASAVNIPERRNIVEAFNNPELIKKHGLDKYEIVVGPIQLPEDEYYQMMGNSKVCLSPPGGGWDCFRHYEALAAGSFPVMARHWHWHPEGYTTPVGAMDQARVALTDGPDWLSKVGINLEDDLYKATFIVGEIKKLFRRTNEPAPNTATD